MKSNGVLRKKLENDVVKVYEFTEKVYYIHIVWMTDTYWIVAQDYTQSSSLTWVLFSLELTDWSNCQDQGGTCSCKTVTCI